MTFSVDDGCASDIRFAELAMQYELPTTFYIPVEWHSIAHAKGYEPLSYEDALSLADYFSIGSHTITHRHLTKLSLYDALYEIQASQVLLEAIFHVKVSKFCPPRGYTNDELTAYTLDHYDSQRLTKGKGLVHIHPNSGANDNMYWTDYFAQLIDSGETDIELWGHSWEWDKYDMWDDITRFIKGNHDHQYSQLR